ncbi:MAG: LamG-like jellyroll fold domain-containing protein, partial [Pirellulales bacterium]
EIQDLYTAGLSGTVPAALDNNVAVTGVSTVTLATAADVAFADLDLGLAATFNVDSSAGGDLAFRGDGGNGVFINGLFANGGVDPGDVVINALNGTTLSLSGVTTANGPAGAEVVVNSAAAADGTVLLPTDNPGNQAIWIAHNAGALELGADLAINFPFGLIGDEGTIRISDAAAAVNIFFYDADGDGNSSPVLEGDGVSKLGGGVTLIGPVSATIISNSNGTLTLDSGGGDAIAADSNNVTFDGEGDIVVENPISGAGVVKNGAGTVTFNGANTYTGQTSINNGKLVVGNNGGLGAATAAATDDTVINAGASLGIDGNLTLPADEKINVSGRGVGGNGAIRSEAGSDNKIAGPIELLANSAVRILNGGSGGGKLTLQGSVDLNGFELEGEGASATHVLQIDGQITGSGGTIDKDDDFMMILTNGANDYSGNTTIDSGVLRITDKDALGDANGITDINADGTLQFHNLAGGVFDAAEEIQYEGDGAGGIGALDNSGGNTTLSASASLTMIGDASIGNSAAGTTFTIEPDVNLGVSTLALAGVGEVDVTGKITDFFGGSGFVPGFYEVDGLIVGEAENYTSRSSGPSGPISNKLTLNFEASEDPDGGADGTWESTTARQSHNWTLGGNVTYNASPATQLPGIAASYVFPTRGSNNAANKATAQQLESLPGNPSNGDATFEIWFKPNNLTGGNQVLWESGGGGDGTSFTIRNGNTLRFTAKDGGSNLVIETTLTPAMASDFIQAVAAYDRNNPNPQDTLRLYINGVEVAGSPVTNNNVNDWAGGDKSGLGGRNGAAGGTGAGANLNYGTFAGEIAIVRIYERRMSAT